MEGREAAGTISQAEPGSSGQADSPTIISVSCPTPLSSLRLFLLPSSLSPPFSSCSSLASSLSSPHSPHQTRHTTKAQGNLLHPNHTFESLCDTYFRTVRWSTM